MKLPDGLTLRPVAETDDGFLRSLFASTRATELAYLPGGEAAREIFLRSQFSAQHQSYSQAFPLARHCIVEIDGVPAGRLYVDATRDPHHVIDVSLLPEYRQLGIGTRLLQAVLAEAADAGCDVSLKVEMSNPAARLYDRLGFQTVSSDGLYLLKIARRSPAID